MEWGCMGFLLGVVVCLVFIGIGFCIGQDCIDKQVPDKHKKKQDRMLTYEDKIMVLNTLRVGATLFEQRVIDEIEEEIKNARREMVKGTQGSVKDGHDNGADRRSDRTDA